VIEQRLEGNDHVVLTLGLLVINPHFGGRMKRGEAKRFNEAFFNNFHLRVDFNSKKKREDASFRTPQKVLGSFVAF